MGIVQIERAERYDAGSNEEYHDGEGVSNSRLKAFRTHPRLYHAYYVEKNLKRPEPTADMQLGTAFDELITLGEFETCAAIPREVLNKDGHRKGSAWKSFAEENAGKVLLKDEQLEQLHAMRDSLMRHDAARKLLGNVAGKSQISLRMTCEETGLLLRCKLDALHSGVIVDLKTASSADPLKFAYACGDFGYDSQAAFYKRLAESFTGESLRFIFVVVEKEFPFRVETYELDAEHLLDADTDLSATLASLAECYRTDKWELPHHGRIVTLPKPPRKKWSA